MSLAWLRFAAAALLISGGLFMEAVSLLGVYRFRFALNRMHTASMADTLGILCIILGVGAAYGPDAALWKLMILVIFMWLASPIASHLIAELEMLTDPELEKHLSVETLAKSPSQENTAKEARE